MIESRWWAVAYLSQSGSAGTLDIQIEQAEPFPVCPEFWQSMLNFVRDQKDGALLALTPVSAPFGSVIGGRLINKPY